MNNDGLFFDVIEDNLVQLRHDTKGERPEFAAEGESRLLSNLAVLIAAGWVDNAALFCAELLGRLDEIRLFSGDKLEMLDPEHVREDMGSHRFTYLHLHQGEVYAAQAVVKAEARPSPTLVPRTTEVTASQPVAGAVLIAEDLPNAPGETPGILEFAERLVAMPDHYRKQFERSGRVELISYDARYDAFHVRLACGVEWYFNPWDHTPSRMISHDGKIPTQEVEIEL